MRPLSLEELKPMAKGVVWRGKLSPVASVVIEEVLRDVAERFPEWARADAE